MKRLGVLVILAALGFLGGYLWGYQLGLETRLLIDIRALIR